MRKDSSKMWLGGCVLGLCCPVLRGCAGQGRACHGQLLRDSKTRGTLGAAQPDTEKAWGAQAVETHEDDPLGSLHPEPVGTPAEEPLPGLDAKAWVEIKDTLGPLRHPQRGPEPDLDSLYHPVGPPRRPQRGPEPDLDSLCHPPSALLAAPSEVLSLILTWQRGRGPAFGTEPRQSEHPGGAVGSPFCCASRPRLPGFVPVLARASGALHSPAHPSPPLKRQL
ncbi:PREDICTED: proline-rich acidic protein 1 [Dipodomys ordii]|uniref:Proline-rich acidic protein 1 n=1 Tax=Dipodomys ordii TaxID=10020 RepID=A0A1S3GRN3_DIPOR|nr:PREDICTED: proline-rich acidic protein 1 [Dipodomys ordii]